MSGRRVSSVFGSAFLLAVLLLGVFLAWDRVSEPNEPDMAPLVRDLAQFTVPSGATVSPAVAVACTGDGLSPHAERRFVVHTSHEAVAAELESQADELGWTLPSDVELGGLIRNDRMLAIGYGGGEDSSGASWEFVTLTVHIPGHC